MHDFRIDRMPAGIQRGLPDPLVSGLHQLPAGNVLGDLFADIRDNYPAVPVGIVVRGTCSTVTNHGFRFHAPAVRKASCKPLYPPPSMNFWMFWKSSCPAMGGPAMSPGGSDAPSDVVTMPMLSAETV